jgi:hypothetical protein
MLGACFSHAQQTKQSFSIIWNYDTSGYLETCGCSSHQLGGLTRRATLLAQLREKQEVLALEGAHIVEDRGDFQLFKGEMIVRMLNEMGYHGLMLGVREAQHGIEGITTLKNDAKFPLFSANLMHNGQPAVQRYIETVVGGNRVFVTGVSQPESVSFDLPEGISFAEAWGALDAALSARSPRTDLTVICLEGETSWISQTVTRYADKADLFLSGDRSVGAAELGFTASPPRLNNMKLGRYAGVLSVDPAAEGYLIAGSNIPLKGEINDHPMIRSILDNEYKTQLKDRFFGTMKIELEKLYLPPEYCAECHQEAYDVYMRSGHAKALITLEEINQLYNPDCMKCHVSYDSSENKLVAMDCTTCHTNIDEDHVWQAINDPLSIKTPSPPVTTYTYGWCYQCHDEANSHRFKGHWPQMVNKIAHGGDLAPAQAAASDLGINMTDPPPAKE